MTITVAGNVILNGGGANGVGGGLIASGSITVQTTSTSYDVSGQISFTAADDAAVIVSSGLRLTALASSVINIAPKLFLQGGDLYGTGQVIVQDIELTNVGAQTGEVRMDNSLGVLDILGDIHNPSHYTFTASNIRLLGAFTRTIIGTIQTQRTSRLTLGCSTTLTAQSVPIFGGELRLNGQSLTITNDITINGNSLTGPGFVRFADGCSCAPPQVVLAPFSSFNIRGHPILQNVVVFVNATRNIFIDGAASKLEVAGAKSQLLLHGRIQGTGSLNVYSAIIGATGRLNLSPTSIITYEVPVVNNGTDDIDGVLTLAVHEPESACADDACLRSTVSDLRRQLIAMTAALQGASVLGACASGACPGWNADYTGFSCA